MLNYDSDFSETATKKDINIIKDIANIEIKKNGVMLTCYEDLVELFFSLDEDEEMWCQDDAFETKLERQDIIQLDHSYYED